MISRLSASAAVFAIVATAGIAFAAEARQHPAAARIAAPASTATITLPRVEVTGKRLTRG